MKSSLPPDICCSFLLFLSWTRRRTGTTCSSSSRRRSTILLGGGLLLGGNERDGLFLSLKRSLLLSLNLLELSGREFGRIDAMVERRDATREANEQSATIANVGMTEGAVGRAKLNTNTQHIEKITRITLALDGDSEAELLRDDDNLFDVGVSNGDCFAHFAALCGALSQIKICWPNNNPSLCVCW
jgi:hypothetical protein